MDINTNSSNLDQEKTDLIISQEVRTYLEGLLEDAGMVMTDDLLKEEMIKEIYVRLDNYLTTTIIDNLPSEDLDTFIKMNTEKRSKEEIENFLKEKMPNYKSVLADAFADFRNQYLGSVTAARNAPKTDQVINKKTD